MSGCWLWSCGEATALLAAGTGVVRVRLVRGMLDIPILSAKDRLVNQAMAVVVLPVFPAGGTMEEQVATGVLSSSSASR